MMAPATAMRQPEGRVPTIAIWGTDESHPFRLC
jgi:hypothetical protein